MIHLPKQPQKHLEKMEHVEQIQDATSKRELVIGKGCWNLQCNERIVQKHTLEHTIFKLLILIIIFYSSVLLIRWSRVRISPDPLSMTKPRFLRGFLLPHKLHLYGINAAG
jgi:hypothetical protein